MASSLASNLASSRRHEPDHRCCCAHAWRGRRGKKSGVRLRKQGAKANKFDAEAAGKKANKKNGLVH